jgi:predicted RNA binding protein YcfA (HicA-like mRNA interferase family)
VKPGQSKPLSVPVHKGKDVESGTAHKILKDANIQGDKK